uniref:Uncharacterized protein n=1 Tax=Oryza glumipatula TaxID=40148 RepID=A0A0E0BGX4_9ORYZ
MKRDVASCNSWFQTGQHSEAHTPRTIQSTTHTHPPWFSLLLLLQRRIGLRSGVRVNGEPNLARSCSVVAAVISSQGKSTNQVIEATRSDLFNLFVERRKRRKGATALFARTQARSNRSAGGRRRHWRGSLCIVASVGLASSGGGRGLAHATALPHGRACLRVLERLAGL